MSAALPGLGVGMASKSSLFREVEEWRRVGGQALSPSQTQAPSCQSGLHRPTKQSGKQGAILIAIKRAVPSLQAPSPVQSSEPAVVVVGGGGGGWQPALSLSLPPLQVAQPRAL